jgi:hypothetical protein
VADAVREMEVAGVRLIRSNQLRLESARKAKTGGEL